MFQQKSTETVTLTRPQLQAILEIMSQIGGVNRSESWNESKPRHYRNDNKLMFPDYSGNHSEDRQSISDNSQWVRHSDDLLTTDWDKEIEDNGRASSLVLINDSSLHNQLLSPTSSNSSKGDELRADSVMTSDTSKDSNFRRYVRTNDSEFDWNDYHQKQIKALEYSKALAQQHQEKQMKKMEEHQRRKTEEYRLEKRVEEQRIKMNKDFEREQKDIEEKRISAEKKREAVIAAIERTNNAIIKKRNFLVESPTESQPVAAIKPQTRAKEISTQTEIQSQQNCEIGTQTDVQLLLYLLQEMNLITKEKSKSEETLSKTSTSKSVTTNLPKRYKSNLNISQENSVPKRGVWVKKQNMKSLLKNEKKTSFKATEVEDNTEEKEKESIAQNENTNNSITKEETNKKEEKLDAIRRQSLHISSSVDNFDHKKKRVMSSIDLKSKTHFLPQISARPHSRKKWYSQETFDPRFMN